MPCGQKSLINKHRGKKMYGTHTEALIGDEQTYNFLFLPLHRVPKLHCEAIDLEVMSLASFRTGVQPAQVHLPLMPPIPTPICSDPFAKITSSVASCSKTSFGGSTKSSSFEPGLRATFLEVFLAKIQILQKGFLGNGSAYAQEMEIQLLS